MKEKITNHGMFHDSTNLKALIEAQANTEAFLDKPKDYKEKCNEKYKNRLKTKKLILNIRNQKEF